jgi:hypothetical protein
MEHTVPAWNQLCPIEVKLIGAEKGREEERRGEEGREEIVILRRTMANGLT